MEIGSAGVKALLSRYREQLAAPELLEETEQRYLTIRDEWQRRSAEMSSTSESLYAEAQSLAETAPDSFSDPARALAYLERVRQLEGEIESARAELREAYRSYRQQRSFVEDRSAAITEAIEDDLRVLQEAAGNFSADAGRAISRSAAPILRERIGPAWDYAERALAVLERLQGEGEGRTRRYRDARRQGTTVTFPVRRTPRFLLRHFQLSGGAAGSGEAGEPAPHGGSDLHSLTLRNLTGNQELSGRPTTLSLQSRDGFRRFSAELRFDLRPEATQRMSARGAATGISVELQEGLEALAVDTLEAQTHTAFEIDIAPDGAGRGELDIRLEELQSSFTADDSLLAEASRSLLDGLDQARFKAALEFTATELSGIEVSSDLDERLAKRLETRLAEEAAALEKQLETAFFGELAEARQRSSALREEIEAQGRQLQEHLQTAERAEQLTARQAERIEERIAELRGGAEKRIREEAEKKLEELKLPGF
jgi:uncharacterized protein (TIGR03545 family)